MRRVVVLETITLCQVDADIWERSATARNIKILVKYICSDMLDPFEGRRRQLKIERNNPGVQRR